MTLHPTLLEAAKNAKVPLIGAHRGTPNLHLENTLASFQAAALLGADFIELDVQLSQDGIPVVIHDETINRTTAGTGLVKDLSLKELQYWGPIPSLDEVLAALSQQVYYNIELKRSHNDHRMLDAVLALVRSHGLQEQVIISSFHHNLLYQLKLLDQHILTGVLFEKPLTNAAAYAKRLTANALHPYFRLANRKLALECQEAGLMIFPWTVDKGCHIQYFNAIKVTGIITNRTDYAVQLLKKDR